MHAPSPAALPEIVAWQPVHQDQVVNLILHIQNVESQVGIALADQPDLLDIERNYIAGGGGFWVALDDTQRVVGTIGLQIKTAQIAVMKKFFVAAAWRGAGKACASRLFDTLSAHAQQRGVATLVLDTPSSSTRSHRFYERQGFRQIARAELPVQYDYPDRDSLLFRLDFAGQKKPAT
jgi:N-acetylglutamate synthase-like GNAT family acetyltransferase